MRGDGRTVPGMHQTSGGPVTSCLPPAALKGLFVRGWGWCPLLTFMTQGRGRGAFSPLPKPPPRRLPGHGFTASHDSPMKSGLPPFLPHRNVNWGEEVERASRASSAWFNCQGKHLLLTRAGGGLHASSLLGLPAPRVSGSGQGPKTQHPCLPAPRP